MLKVSIAQKFKLICWYFEFQLDILKPTLRFATDVFGAFEGPIHYIHSLCIREGLTLETSALEISLRWPFYPLLSTKPNI